MNDEQAKQLLDECDHKGKSEFLKSWKVAVNMIGIELFDVNCSSVEAATHRDELRPNLNAIEKYVHHDSPTLKVRYG